MHIAYLLLLWYHNYMTTPDSAHQTGEITGNIPKPHPNALLLPGVISVHEVLQRPTTEFPEFDGDLTRWNRDIAILTNALEHPRGFEYEAQLPDIVGYMSPEEAAVIDSWGDVDASYSDDEGSDRLDDIRKQLPGLMQTIEKDLDLITAGQGRFTFVEWEKYFTEAGKIGKGNGEFHVDEMVNKEEDVLTTHYFFANKEPTLYYRGPAKLFRLKSNGALKLDTDSLDHYKPGAVVAAPPYAIVRANGTTVHGSPSFKKSSSRAFMRATSGLITPGE